MPVLTRHLVSACCCSIDVAGDASIGGHVTSAQCRSSINMQTNGLLEQEARMPTDNSDNSNSISSNSNSSINSITDSINTNDSMQPIATTPAASITVVTEPAMTAKTLKVNDIQASAVLGVDDATKGRLCSKFSVSISVSDYDKRLAQHDVRYRLVKISGTADNVAATMGQIKTIIADNEQQLQAPDANGMKALRSQTNKSSSMLSAVARREHVHIRLNDAQSDNSQQLRCITLYGPSAGRHIVAQAIADIIHGSVKRGHETVSVHSSSNSSTTSSSNSSSSKVATAQEARRKPSRSTHSQSATLSGSRQGDTQHSITAGRSMQSQFSMRDNDAQSMHSSQRQDANSTVRDAASRGSRSNTTDRRGDFVNRQRPPPSAKSRGSGRTQ